MQRDPPPPPQVPSPDSPNACLGCFCLRLCRRWLRRPPMQDGPERVQPGKRHPRDSSYLLRLTHGRWLASAASSTVHSQKQHCLQAFLGAFVRLGDGERRKTSTCDGSTLGPELRPRTLPPNPTNKRSPEFLSVFRPECFRGSCRRRGQP